MTFNEGWIEVLKGGASLPLDSARSDLPKFGVLEARPGWGDYWVPRVQRWAQQRGASIHYIDNCWLNVAVSAEDLRSFLNSLDQRDTAWLKSLLSMVDDRDSYIIAAEEF